ncbi:MAG: hypothetical protein Q4D45_12915 [Lachnospiraceae bacterium]|nr:hypothetical protein [Lachnospiraceae bacterium]
MRKIMRDCISCQNCMKVTLPNTNKETNYCIEKGIVFTKNKRMCKCSHYKG